MSEDTQAIGLFIIQRRATRMNLASQLRNLEPRVTASPWKGFEHVHGFGVMALPFSSGHVLALRVFPENDFAPYITIWHRLPDK